MHERYRRRIQKRQRNTFVAFIADGPLIGTRDSWINKRNMILEENAQNIRDENAEWQHLSRDKHELVKQLGISQSDIDYQIELDLEYMSGG